MTFSEKHKICRIKNYKLIMYFIIQNGYSKITVMLLELI